MKQFAFAVATVACLSACAPQPDPQVIRQQLEASDLSSLQSAALLVEVPALQGIAVLTEVGRNDDTVTFASADGKSVSLRSGLLVRTAGFGADLYFSDTTATHDALRARTNSTYRRSFQFLTERERIDEEEVLCDMQRLDRQMVTIIGTPRLLWRSVETCRGKDVSFQNDYWHEDAGLVIKSKERVSFGLGSVMIEALQP